MINKELHNLNYQIFRLLIFFINGVSLFGMIIADLVNIIKDFVGSNTDFCIRNNTGSDCGSVPSPLIFRIGFLVSF